MNAFERRQQVVEQLRKKPGLGIPDLAREMAVSPGTIRNDLTALEQEGRLIRVHGGAAIIDNGFAFGPSFAARSHSNDLAKRVIAAHAAELVSDGDAILLDASTTVLNLTHNLHNRHNLRVFTNGIEAARSMAKDPTNTVTLLGGVLNTDGSSISGLVSEQFLKGLHIKTAFVSCSGFSPEAGLTEVNLNQAQLKSKMIGAASRVIALIDSSKFGKIDLTAFAALDQIDYLYTDQALSAEWITRLKQSGLAFSVCSENHAQTFTGNDPDSNRYRIGFSYPGEGFPFASEVYKGIVQAASAAGNIDLILANNLLDGDAASRTAAEWLSQGVDLVIEDPIDGLVSSRSMGLYQAARIPVISVDAAILGAIYFGVDHYRAGLMAATALGEWVRNHWNGQFDRLVTCGKFESGSAHEARLQSLRDALEVILGPVGPDKCLNLISGPAENAIEQSMAALLAQHPDLHHWAVIGTNDSALRATIAAARQLGRVEEVVVVGLGASQWVFDELAGPGSCLIGSTVLHPEKYGEQLINLALQILQGEPVPPAVYIEQTFDFSLPILLPDGPLKEETLPGIRIYRK